MANFYSSGQVCSNGTRVFVQDTIHDDLVEKLGERTKAIRIGEAIERANATHFGLSGAVFTRNFSRAHRVANRLQAGSVWINDYNVTPPEVPFGGYKQSGLGRENGLQAIEHFTQVKTVYVNLGDVPETF